MVGGCCQQSTYTSPVEARVLCIDTLIRVIHVRLHNMPLTRLSSLAVYQVRTKVWRTRDADLFVPYPRSRSSSSSSSSSGGGRCCLSVLTSRVLLSSLFVYPAEPRKQIIPRLRPHSHFISSKEVMGGPIRSGSINQCYIGKPIRSGSINQ